MSILDVIYFVLLIAAFIISVLRVRLLKSIKSLRILLLLLIGVQGFAEYLNVNELNNVYLYHFLTPIECFFLMYIYLKNINSIAIKRTIRIVLFLLPFLFFYFTLLDGLQNNNSLGVLLEGFCLILFSVIGLKSLMGESGLADIKSYPFFWFCIGTLFYGVGNLLVLGFMNYLVEYDLDLAKVLYKITYIFSYQFFILISYAAFVPK